MSYVDSTVMSPLADLDEGDMFDALDRPEEEIDEIEERQPAQKPAAGSLKQALIDQIDDINLARYLDDQTLDSIGVDVVREYEIDINSRADWVTKARKALRFATQDSLPKQYPWPGASNVIYPLITHAALDFAARTSPAIVRGRNVVRGIVWGEDRGKPMTMDGTPEGQPKMGPDGQPVWLVKPGEKRARADRVGEFMSWQLLSEMPEWKPQTDQMMHQIPVIGGGSRKTFYDPRETRNKSLFVSLQNLVWNYHAPSFEAAPRVTEKILLYPNDIIELERAGDEGDGGMFLPLDYGPGGPVDGENFGLDETQIGADQSDDDAPHFFLEQHRRLDLDEDGYPEPYIVTVHRRSSKVVRIVARYDAEGIEADADGNTIRRIVPVDHYTLYRFLPNIEGGSYPMGFGHYLKTINEAINTTYNQMFDAGHLANAGGGFISDQLGLPSGQTLFQVGKFTRVTTKGAAIRDAVLPLPFNGPNAVLFQVLGTLIQAGEKIAGIGNILTGDAAIANAPPTTVLALIEQGMNFYTAIVERVFTALKQELAKLFRLNKLHIDAAREFEVGDEWKEITPDDFRLSGGVEPVSDPTQTTDMQKLGRGQLLMSFNGDQLIDQRAIRRRFFEAANIERIDELIIPPDPNAAQMAQTMAQIAMAEKQAEIGKMRAAELKDQTQAFLNMALARKNANSQEEAWIESQLDFLRLHIEALNTQVKAAAVDHRFHDTNMRTTMSHAQMLADDAAQRRELAAASPGAVQPTPGPTGAFPTPPSAPVGPDVTGPSSPDTGSPLVPSGPGAGPAGPGNPAPAPLGA